MHRIDAKASWWDDEESESHSHEEVDVKLGYTDDTLYVDNLIDGRYLAIPLKAIGRAIAEGATTESPNG